MTHRRRFSDPTSPESRALTAAMRIALGSTLLVGCGGRVAPDHDGPALAQATSNAAPGAPATTIPEATSERSPTPLPTASTPVPPGTSAPAADVPCGERLEAAFPDGGTPWFLAGVPTKDPALAACCERLEAATAPDVRVDVVRASGCCNVEFPGWGAACTSWGPPVPPSMPARVA